MTRTLLTAFAAIHLLTAQPQAEKLFGQALMKERSQGDLKAAIELFQRIASDGKTNRKLAAKALLEMARCQEKQGGEQARRTYERLLKDFADQPDSVAAARARITALTATGSGPRVRQLWAGPGADNMGSISPDGRWLTYAHWETGDLGLRDLQTNTSKLLTNTGGWEKSNYAFAQNSRFSPDGKKIAYNWFFKRPDGTDGCELRLMNADGSGVRTIGWPGSDGYPRPLAWSPDGNSLVAAFLGTGDSWAIYLLSVSTGDRKELVAPGQTKAAYHASFSPDGKWLAFSGASLGSSDVYVIPASGGEPVPVVTHAANDSHPHWSADGRGLFFASSRAGSAGIWRIPVENGKAAGPAVSIREDLGQQIIGIGFTASGALVFARWARGLDIFSANVDPATGRLDGRPELISASSPGSNTHSRLSNDGRKLAYNTGLSGSSNLSLTVRDVVSGQEKTFPIRQGAMAHWHVDNRQLIVVERGTAPDSVDLTWLDANTGERTPFRSIVNPTGFPLSPAFSPDGKTLYYQLRQRAEQGSVLVAMNVASGESRTIYKASLNDGGNLRGIALSPDGKLLASLRVLPKNRKELVLFPVDGGQARVVAAYADVPQPYTAPAFSHDGRAVFVSVSRGSSQSGDSELVRIDLATGAIQPTGIQKPRILHPNVDSSGKKIYFQAGTQETEIWIAENILPVAH